MELLKNTVPNVEFYLPSDDTTVNGVKWKRGDSAAVSLAFDVAAGVATTRLPYLVDEGEVQVIWTFTIPGSGSGIVHTDYYSVIKPYLTSRDIRKIHPEATDEEVVDLEAAVRHIINAHTGQEFGHSVKPVLVTGDGNDSLALPEHLITFTGLQADGYGYNINAFSIGGDGWYLRLFSNSLETIKEMPSEYSLDAGAVITTPFTAYYRGFHPGRKYTITGEWGWRSVPEAVKEAALLLANDYACSEQAYRDRFLKSIRAADWRLEFNSGAYEQTGNVRADQLLANYVKLNWAII